MSLVSVTNDYDLSGDTALQLEGSTQMTVDMNDVEGWNDNGESGHGWQSTESGD